MIKIKKASHKNITIWDQLIDSRYLLFIRFYYIINVLLNALMLVSFFLYNLSDRIGNQVNNIIPSYIQLGCNISLTVSLLFYVIAKRSALLKQTWFWLECISIIARQQPFNSYLTLLDYKQIYILRIIRSIRVLVLIKFFQPLERQLEMFLKTIPALLPVIATLFMILLVYTTYNLHAFYGLTDKRCRIQKEPYPNGTWTIDQSLPVLCGRFQCPGNLTCGSIFDIREQYPYTYTTKYLDNINFGYGLQHFDNFLYAIVSSFKITFGNGWSASIITFKRSITQYVVVTIGVTFVFLCSYIMLNIVLGALAEGFFQSKIKAHKQKMEEKLNFQIQNKDQKIQKLPRTTTDKIAELSLTVKSQESEQIQDSIFTKMQSYTKTLAFELVHSILIISSCVCLLIIYDNQSKYEFKIISILNTIFSILFIIECIFMLVAYKILNYFSQSYRYIQFTIFVLNLASIIEFFVNGFQFQHKSQFNNIAQSFLFLRTLDLFVFSSFFTQQRKAIKTLFLTVQKLIPFVLMWIYFCPFVSIIGYQLFAYNLRIKNGKLDPQGLPPIINYDGPLNSVIATMFIFYNQEMLTIMYEYSRYNTFAALFYCLSVSLLMQLLLKLFLALYLNNFMSLLNLEDKIDEKEIQKTQLHYLFQKYFPFCFNQYVNEDQELQIKQLREGMLANPEENDFVPKIQKVQSKKKKKRSVILKQLKSNQQTQQPKQQYGLVIRKIKLIIEHKYFHNFIILLIIISSIRFIFDTPYEPENSLLRRVFQIIDHVISVFYYLQLIGNIVCYGFISNKNSYLRKSWINWINLVVVGFSIARYFVSGSQSQLCQKIKILRLCYLIVLRENNNLHMRFTILAFKSLAPKLIKLSVIAIIVLLFFSTILTKLYYNQLEKCVNAEIQIINTKWQCYDYGGDWVDEDTSYQNVLETLIQLYILSTTSGWFKIVTDTMNQRGPSLTPIQYSNINIGVLFMIIFFFGNMIVMNTFIGVNVQTFLKLKKKLTFLDQLTDEQTQWHLIKEAILRLKPLVEQKQPENKFKKICFLMYRHKYYKITMGFLSIIYILTSFSFNADASTNTIFILQISRDIFILIMFIDMLINVIGRGTLPFFQTLFRFQIFILLYSIFYIIYIDLIKQNNTSQVARILNSINVILLVSRFYKCNSSSLDMQYITKVKQLFSTLIIVIPKTVNIFLVMITILYIYTIFGMHFYAFLKPQTELNEFDQHFRYFFSALFTLIKFATLQNNDFQLKDASRSLGPNFICFQISTYQDYVIYGLNGCGNQILSIFFYISFHILFALMTINMFVATVLDAYNQSFQAENMAVSKSNLGQTLNLWKQFDSQGNGFISYRDFWVFLSKMSVIFEVPQKELKADGNKKKFLTKLNIPIYINLNENTFNYRFHDVVISVSRMVMELKYNVNNDISLEPEQKQVRQRLQGLLDQGPPVYSHQKTNYNSEKMITINFIKEGLRTWRNKVTGNQNAISGIGDLKDARNNLRQDKQQKITKKKLIGKERLEALAKDPALKTVYKKINKHKQINFFDQYQEEHQNSAQPFYTDKVKIKRKIIRKKI